jgi:hypothetical protein
MEHAKDKLGVRQNYTKMIQQSNGANIRLSFAEEKAINFIQLNFQKGTWRTEPIHMPPNARNRRTTMQQKMKRMTLSKSSLLLT